MILFLFLALLFFLSPNPTNSLPVNNSPPSNAMASRPMGKPYAPKMKRWSGGATTPVNPPPTDSASVAPKPMQTPASVPRAATRGRGMAALEAPTDAARRHKSAPTVTSAIGSGPAAAAGAGAAGVGAGAVSGWGCVE